MCPPMGGGAAGWVASLSLELPHGILLRTFFTGDHFFNHTFPVRFQKSEVIATVRPQPFCTDVLQQSWVSEFG